MVRKIISGGQTGADIAALQVAKRLGLETGGFISKGFRTIEGARPELAEQYGLIEMDTVAYPPRTYSNVEVSDGTMRFAYSFLTRGEQCTMKAIKKFNKPYFDVDVAKQKPFPFSSEILLASAWIMDNNIRVLNVAGNAVPDIEPFVIEFLEKCLRISF